jgi:excisionase family DNA binding protein
MARGDRRRAAHDLRQVAVRSAFVFSEGNPPMSTKSIKPRRYGTLDDAAAYLRISKKTARRWVDQGRLPAYRVGPRYVRVDLNELESAVVRPIPPTDEED